jgi:Tol biopolymer transport system component
MATRDSVDDPFRAPAPVDELGGFDESDHLRHAQVSLSGDDTVFSSRGGSASFQIFSAHRMYFASNRENERFHIYVAERQTRKDSFGTVQPVKTGAHGTDTEMPGWLSNDGCRLYFQSSRNGNDDLWVASKDK